MAILYIVATPIGNLEDITFRAVKTLGSVDLIACEDTRATKKLLNRYNIDVATISYHQHSSLARINQLVKELKSGKDIALVSDAGTPSISDPGGKLVAAVIAAGIKVVPIPGPSAVIAILSVAGFAADNFVFFGFVPHKKGRQTLFKEIAKEKRTVVFYDSPHRIVKTLQQLSEYIGGRRQIVVGRELTKIYEEIIRGPIEEVLNQIRNKGPKGEFVVAVEGAK